MSEQVDPDEGAYDALKPRERMYVEEWLRTFNQTKAAEAAGYKAGEKAGWRMNRRPEVQAAIRERLAAVKVPTAAVEERITQLVFGDLSDCLDQYGRIDVKAAKEAGKLYLIHSITEGDRGGKSIKGHNPLAAAELLLKMRGELTEKHEHSGPGGGPLQFTEIVVERQVDDAESPASRPVGDRGRETPAEAARGADAGVG